MEAERRKSPWDRDMLVKAWLHNCDIWSVCGKARANLNFTLRSSNIAGWKTWTKKSSIGPFSIAMLDYWRLPSLWSQTTREKFS